MGPSVSLLLLFVRPAASAILLATARRTRIGVAMQVLVKSDDAFDYFRRWDTLDVTLRKPLGATLVEVVATGQAPAVKVKALQEDGSAAAMLKPGDIIRSVMGESVAAMGFDGVMAALGAAPDEVRIGVSRAVISREPRVEEPTKLEKAFDKNFGSAEAAGKLGNKMVKITLNPTTWKNPIYYVSALSVFVPLFFIASYGAGK